MSSAANAFLVACAAIALVVAQDLYPSATFYHTWQYAAVLCICIVVLAAHLIDARKSAPRTPLRRAMLSMTGALVVATAGLASGLLGPDTQTLGNAPGTVAPLPDLAAAAVFPIADPATIARGNGAITLRRRSGPDAAIPAGTSRIWGAAIVRNEPARAAYIDVADASGRHLTITQPSGTSFLSPVLLFARRTSMLGRELPTDSFAVPSAHRTVSVVALSSRDADALHVHREPAGSDALLFAVHDDGGKVIDNGIGLAPSGSKIALGGLEISSTIGTYPTLVVASAPHPIPLGAGLLLFTAGILATLRRQTTPANLHLQTATTR